MKNAILIVTFLASLSACNGGDEKADAYGNFETDELTVSSEASGKLLVFNAEEGQNLKAGDLVAVIDTTQLYLKKEQVKATIAAVRKKLPNEAAQLAIFDQRMDKINTEITRISKLVAANAAPSKQLDDLKAELDGTMKQRAATASTLGTQTQGMLAEIDPMRFQLMQIEGQLRKSYIYNPINGSVLTTLAKSGELTMMGKALYKIASLDPLVLKAYVSEDMLGEVKIGDKVTVNTDNPDGTMKAAEGTVTWISSEAEFTPKMIQTKDERATQVYAMKIDVPNDGSLKIGMPAEVEFGGYE
ncbi:MAG: HlyD family efflux transporter periplasmic adaptor subunit [Flavobacteriales bacterium]|nr:HlyD family efflux transporter periplasmic adaptor subunit [Flavobacteriales bacterium]